MLIKLRLPAGRQVASLTCTTTSMAAKNKHSTKAFFADRMANISFSPFLVIVISKATYICRLQFPQ
jgi:hypothetical protein